MVAIMVTAVGIPAYFFAEPLLRIFCADPEAIYFGARMLRTIMPFYFIMGFQQMFGGVIRGYGCSAAAMILTLSGIVGVRQVWLSVTLYIEHDIKWIYRGYPLGWAVTAASMLVFYLLVIRRKFPTKIKTVQQSLPKT